MARRTCSWILDTEHKAKTKAGSRGSRQGERSLTAAHLGLKHAKRKPGWGRAKADKPPLEVAAGKTAMARRYQ